jgi:orotate phosphoribosyltransferase-like protein
MPFKPSKTKEYAVLYLHRVVLMDIEQIAEELNIAESTVSSILDKNPEQKAKNKSSFITETSHKKIGNVAIMTQEASLGGQSLSNIGKVNTTNIFKPRG